jgi:lysozyme
MTALVLDLSHHNTISSDLSGAKAAGIIGVIHKATEGTAFQDPKLWARHSLTKDVGLEWGVYHFLTPGNIAGQVESFLSYTKTVSDERTLFAADYEDPKISISDLKKFLSMLAERTGRLPVLYSGIVLKDSLQGQPDPELSKYRLWLAQYGPTAVLPPGWNHYWLWQYTETGKISGIGPTVDISKYDGSAEELRSEWPGQSTASVDLPLPEEPKEQIVTVTIEAPPGVKINVIQKVV